MGLVSHQLPTLTLKNDSCIFPFPFALQILGFRVVASSSTAVKQDYNEYMWTMRKEFDEPEPLETESVVRENLSNIGREAASLGNYHKVDLPE